jgi:7-cyano-7-deazaguanine synthase
VALSLGVKRHLVMKIDLREIGGSALTSDLEVPKASQKVHERGSAEGERHRETSGLPDFRTTRPGGLPKGTGPIPVTYVPARNTIFLSFALGWAEVLGAGDIFIGANAIDYSGYPDCRPEYLRAFEDMANLATRVSVEGKLRFRIRAPLVTLKKSEIIRNGAALGLDYSLTWSCYDPQPVQKRGKADSGEPETSGLPDFRPCGLCDSCRLRAKGFAEAGLDDPLLMQPHFNEDRSLL